MALLMMMPSWESCYLGLLCCCCYVGIVPAARQRNVLRLWLRSSPAGALHPFRIDSKAKLLALSPYIARA